jgi:hypothetical protein
MEVQFFQRPNGGIEVIEGKVELGKGWGFASVLWEVRGRGAR